ncbi:MAG: class I SAM-dependent methyltransferase [Terriglobales bacterium]
MHSVTRCLICNGNSLESRRALFSPFIAKRIWNRRPFPIQLLRCKACSFTFANPRFDPEEEKTLYAGYRGAEYQRTRYGCEPWYTEGFNRNLFSPEVLAKRRGPLAAIFREHIPRSVKTILDFGGDRGDLFEGLVPGSLTYLYDISGIEPVNGVKALRGLDECTALRFDLIACSNVLEHVGSPRNIVGEINKIAAPDSLYFIEVPSESPFGVAGFVKRFAQQLILIGARPGLAASMLPFGFARLVHEHVNFFSLESLTKLMQVSGLEVLAEGLYRGESFGFGPYKLAAGSMAWCLARRQDEHDDATLPGHLREGH